MIFYSILIAIAWTILIVLNVIFAIPIFNFSVWYIIGAVVFDTICVIAVDGITATIIRLLPNKWFDPFFKRFNIAKWEKVFYERIGIKKWKDWVPELGHFTKVRNNKIADPTNNEYIRTYMMEVAYGIVIHSVSMLTGFAIIFIYPLKYMWCFGIPVAIVNIFINYLSVAILRYNMPKLKVVYKMNERKALRGQKENI